MTDKNKIVWKEILPFTSFLYICIGVLCVVVSFKGFMLPNKILDGGVTGLSIILHELTQLNVSIYLVVLNLPFLYLGYRKLGISFAIRGFFAVILMAVSLYLIHVPSFTQDKILTAVFGGGLVGLGIGLVIKGGGILDGLEVIVDYTNKKSGISSSEIVLVFNSITFLLLAIGVGLEPAMYSILTFYTAVKASDYVVDGFEQYTSLTIVSKNEQAVKSIIVNDFKKAITVYKGERGYLPESFDTTHNCDIIVTVVTRLEIHRIKKAISHIDPTAFIYIQSINEVKGGIVKKLRPH